MSEPVSAPDSPDAPFDPPGLDWQPVQRQLATARWLTAGVTFGVLGLAAIVLALLTSPWAWIGVGVVVALAAWVAWLIPRQVRAIRWAVRGRDLVVRKGIMFRRLAVVPYVRVQYVDIEAGPLDRHFGLANLKVNTAAAGVAVDVPGLAPDTAARLREILTDKANLEPAA
ncbi:MAG: PH domain-containing protein [Propionibacteriaceae bacterium]|jgi:membrane protein YdbS with pleckstrin-like domain|nr:PH domain-containing protein [Propionibacteriaceae bacterium]